MTFRFRTRRLALAATFLGALLLGGCHDYLQTPASFGEMVDQDEFEYRATSAEGVVIAVEQQENDPEGSLEFWSDVLDSKLSSRGYDRQNTLDVKSVDGVAGKQMRYHVQKDGRPHAYWVSIYVSGGSVYLVQAGGDRAYFEGREKEIEKAMESFDL